ncbi:MAG: hypothetical protein PW843_30345 [Azospirillaceae bacterium]|nr:hypothetical protein [Azospirillaceae bacterium]
MRATTNNTISKKNLISFMSATWIIIMSDSFGSPSHAAVFQDMSISPDGETLALQYRGEVNGLSSIILMNVNSGLLSNIDNPQGYQVGSPSFSSDGKKIAVVIESKSGGIPSDIGYIDTEEKKVHFVTNGMKDNITSRGYPIFFPDGNKILYTKGGIGKRTNFFSIEIDGRGDKKINKDQYSFISNISSRPFFISNDEFVFLSKGQTNIEINNYLKSIGVDSVYSMSYVLAMNGNLNYSLVDFNKYILSKDKFDKNGLNYLSGSFNYGAYYYVGRNYEDNNRNYRYDVYKINGNENPKRITSADGDILYLCSSFFGDRIAFLSSPGDSGKMNVHIVDLKNSTDRIIDLPLL